jgi:hypothetical protein
VVAAAVAATTIAMSACTSPQRPEVAQRSAAPQRPAAQRSVTQRPAAPQQSEPPPARVKVDGLGTVALPAGFRLIGAWPVQPGRASFLTLLRDDVYWLTDGRHARPDEAASLHRVERLDPSTGRISVVADSHASVFGGIAAGLDALVVVSEPPLPASACGGAVGGPGGGCVRPTFEQLTPAGAIRRLGVSDPQTQTSFSGYSLDQVTGGVLLEAVRRGHTSVSSWQSTHEPPRMLTADMPGDGGLTAVGGDLVGDYGGGQRRLWTTGPPLPAGAADGGIDPTGAATRLAWYTESASGDDIYVATKHGDSYGPPTRIATHANVYVLDWANDCVLFIRELTGLYVARVCRPGSPVVRLLTADQADQIYNPARFGAAPRRFAFAVDAGRADVLVLLEIPKE